MRSEPPETCAWLERVSAMIDGELDASELPLIRAHARACDVCSRLDAGTSRTNRTSAAIDRAVPIPFERSTGLRVLAIGVGLLIVLASFPGFVRGSTNGDALHDLRHLSIWQVAVGLAVLSTGFTSRFSRVLLVLVAAFLVLTGAAGVYDAFTGHRGPWTDPTHMVEVVAALILLRFSLPLTRLRVTAGTGKSTVRTS